MAWIRLTGQGLVQSDIPATKPYKLTMEKVLIIGGSGFTGRPLVSELQKRGYSVTVLNRGNRKMEGVVQLLADRNSSENLREARKSLGSGAFFDAIIDLSSYTPEQTRLAWQYFSDITKHWIHISSASVYLESSIPPDESFPIGGAAVWGDYGVQKSLIDIFLLDTAQLTPVTILRPPYLYGPGNDSDREQFIWSRALRGLPVFVPGNGSTQMQFLHIEDLASALCYFIQQVPAAKAVYNIGNSEWVSQLEWCSIVLESAELNTRLITLQQTNYNFKAREYFPFRDYPCVLQTKLINGISWRPALSLEKGLQLTFNSYSRQWLNNNLKYGNAESILSGLLT